LPGRICDVQAADTGDHHRHDRQQRERRKDAAHERHQQRDRKAPGAGLGVAPERGALTFGDA
jgi:hypothetical protein